MKTRGERERGCREVTMHDATHFCVAKPVDVYRLTASVAGAYVR